MEIWYYGLLKSRVSKSSCELEYRVLSAIFSDIKSLCDTFRKLDTRFDDSPTIFYDNKSAIFITENPTTTSGSGHLDITYHYLRELVAKGAVKVRVYSICTTIC